MNDERDGDLDGWGEDPLVRALRAPGTPTELAKQGQFTAAFRARVPRRSMRRSVGRLGMGGTAIITTVALSSGVAAAYTNSLPDPVQRFAHSVLGPIGVPPVDPRPEPAQNPAAAPSGGGGSGRAAPTMPATPSAGAPVEPTPSAGPAQPSPTPTAASQPRQPTASPSSTTSPTPDVSPSAAPTEVVRRVPAGLTASASTSYAAVGTTAVISGLLTADDGLPLGGHSVRLRARTVGRPEWTVVARGVTALDGTVALETPPLGSNTVVRLKGGKHAQSRAVRIKVKPTVSATVTGGAVALTSVGGQPGDTVVILRRTKSGPVQVATVVLDGSGSASGEIPQRKRAQRFVLRLNATRMHAKAVTIVKVGPAG